MTMPPILRRPRVLLGAMAAFLVGLICAWFAATEIVYQVNVADIAPRIAPPPEEVLPPRIRQVAWVANGESGEIRMRPAYLGWLPVAILGPVVFARHPNRPWFSSGLNLASRVQVNHFREAGMDLEKRTLATIWITRHWTADQVLSALVGKSWYGCGIYDLDTASRAYLGKPADSLDIPQVVALLAYWQSPERHRKDSVAFDRAYTRLQARVLENFPELAPQQGPMPPFLRSTCPTKPDSL